jgi:hypothetical protein
VFYAEAADSPKVRNPKPPLEALYSAEAVCYTKAAQDKFKEEIL